MCIRDRDRQVSNGVAGLGGLDVRYPPEPVTPGLDQPVPHPAPCPCCIPRRHLSGSGYSRLRASTASSMPALAAVVSGASASVRVRFEVNGASGSLVCGSNARLIPNETNFGTSSAQRFRGTNGWAEVTLNQGGPPKLKVGSDRARHRGKPDDVDAQVGYYRDPFWCHPVRHGGFVPDGNRVGRWRDADAPRRIAGGMTVFLWPRDISGPSSLRRRRGSAL